MNLVFMGTPEYARIVLEGIYHSSHKILAVITQEDKKTGRGQKLLPPPVKEFGIAKNIPIYQPKSLRNEESKSYIENLKPDIIIVAAYGKILPKDILEIAPCVNLHASLLPKYRGASPIQETLLNNDKESGISVMKMDIGMDTGDVFMSKSLEISPNMLYEELLLKLSILAKNMCVIALDNFENLKSEKQNDELVTYCKKIEKNDGLINFDNAENIYNKYRAFHSWPCIFLKSGLKLSDLSVESKSLDGKSGEILEIRKEEVIVACKIGSLRVGKLQPSSKKEMSASSYTNGKRLVVGNILE